MSRAQLIVSVLCLLSLSSCSSQKSLSTNKENLENKETILGPAVADLINYEKVDNKKLDTTEGEIVRYQAAMELLDKAKISLKNYDTPTALKYLVVAKNISPYHGEVKSLYSFATREYINSTKKMIESNIPCEVLSERIRFMYTLAPDSISEVSDSVTKCNIKFMATQTKELSPEEILNLHVPKKNKEVSASFNSELQKVLNTAYSFPLAEMLKLDVLYLSQISYEMDNFSIDPDVDGSGYVNIIAPVKIVKEKSEVEDICKAYSDLLNKVFQNDTSFMASVSGAPKYENQIKCHKSDFMSSILSENKGGTDFSEKISVPKVFYQKIATNYQELSLPIARNNLSVKVKLSYKQGHTEEIDVKISNMGSYSDVFTTKYTNPDSKMLPFHFNIERSHKADSSIIREMKFSQTGEMFYKETKIYIRIKESALNDIDKISISFDFEKMIKETLQTKND